MMAAARATYLMAGESTARPRSVGYKEAMIITLMPLTMSACRLQGGTSALYARYGQTRSSD